MIPVNYSDEFQNKRGTLLKPLYDNETPIMFIANGTFWENSFFVVNKDTMLIMAEILGDVSFTADIKEALKKGKIKISNKYKNLINSRWSKERISKNE